MDVCAITRSAHVAERLDVYTWQCSACGRKWIGPRTVGMQYREGGWTLVEVIEVERVAFDMPSAWAVTVRELDGPTAGLERRHCTAWGLDQHTIIKRP